MTDILLTLRRGPGADEDTGRLRAVLKSLARRHDLQLVDIRDAPESPQLIEDQLPNTTTPTVRASSGTDRRNRPRRNRSPYAC